MAQATVEAVQTPLEEVRREQWVGTLFTTWVVVGLFLDGWAHNAGKPEDFWTPWHGVLYSGFLAGAVWFGLRRRRTRAAAAPQAHDRLMVLGFVMFAIAGAGDAVWHSLFGVEEDVAALLSPTHLALMVGGTILISGPLRSADHLPRPERSWATFAPMALAVALTVAVVAFFLEFASAFHVRDEFVYADPSAGGTPAAIQGVVSILLTNAVLLGGLAWALARWRRPPFGTLTLLLVVPALLLSGLLAFQHVALVLAPLAGGLAGDALLARDRSRLEVLTVVPVVTWSVWFGVFAVTAGGIGWEVEFWTGTVVFAALTGTAYEVLLRASRPEPARSV